MKTLKTSGNFMLVDPQTRTVFDPGVPTLVSELTSFIQERLKSGDLVETTEKGNKPEIAKVFVPAPQDIKIVAKGGKVTVK